MRGLQVTDAATQSWPSCRQHSGPRSLSLRFAHIQMRPGGGSPEMEEGSSQRLPTQGWVATEHDVTPSLEAAYNLPIIGKSGGVAGCRLSGEG